MPAQLLHIGGTARGHLPAIVDPVDGITALAPDSITYTIRRAGSDTAETLSSLTSLATGVYEWAYNPAAETEGEQISIRFVITVTDSNTDTHSVTHTVDLVVVAVERGTDSANTTTPDNAGIAAIKAKTDNLPADPAGVSDIPTTDEIEAALVNEGDATALLQAIADKIAGDLTAGDLTALAIVSAIKADATLATMISRIDAAVSSRLASASYTAPLDSTATQAAAAAAITAAGLATATNVSDAATAIRGADSDTLKTLSDQLDSIATTVATIASSGGALTSEQVALLEAIAAKTAQITAGRIRVNSPVTEGGNISIEIGSDYAGDSAIPLPVSDAGEVLKDYLQSAGVTSVLFGAGQAENANTIVGTITPADITAAGGVTTIPITILSSGFSDAKPSAFQQYDYRYHIKAVDADGEHVKVGGWLTVEPERRSL